MGSTAPASVASVVTVASDIPQPTLRGLVELTGHVEDRLDDLLVARAPAEVALDAGLDLVHARRGVAGQQVADRHDHAAGAEPALHGVVAREGRLDVGQPPLLRLTLDRLDRGAVRLGREGEAGVDRPAVEQDRAGTALAGRAALLRARQPDALAQEAQQRPVLLDLALVHETVHRHRHLHHATSRNALRTYVSTMCSRYSLLQRTSLIGLITALTAATTASAGSCPVSPSTSSGVGAHELMPRRSVPSGLTASATPTMPRSCPLIRLSFR